MDVRQGLAEGTILLHALIIMLATSLPAGLSTADSVQLDRDVTFHGIQLPRQVQPGDTLSVDLFYKTQKLEPDEWIFMHVESAEGGDNCRMVRDVQPGPVQEGIVQQNVQVTVPATCKPGRFEVYSGIYDRGSRQRLSVIKPTSMDDRLHAGYLQIVSERSTDDVVTIDPGHMRWQSRLTLLRPWKWWGLGVLIALILTVVIARVPLGRDRMAAPVLVTTNRPRVWASLLIVFVPLILSILAAQDFVKDDAYISFRYAQNLVAGNGFVFNAGERLEGYTNFLWTVLMVPFEAMGADLFQVCEIIGTALAMVLLAAMTFTIIHVVGSGKALSWLWAALWLSTQSSLGLWSTSGLEQPLAMALPVVAALVLWEGKKKQSRNWSLASGILVGLGCMTRPDLHLMGIVLGIPLLVDVVRTRKLSTFTMMWFAGLLAVTVPFHAFRLLYYGSLFPNTFYVKTGASSLLMVAGLRKLNEMFSFNAIGALVILVPFAFLDRRKLEEKLVMAAIVFGYMAYIVKVGVDEMRWHRLYLPALPFLVMLAMIGLRTLVDRIASMARGRGPMIAAYAVAWLLVIAGATHSFVFTLRSMNGFNGRADLSGTYHPDMGKFITRHERPGKLVAFQDMGSTPYHAPDVSFLDFIGLTDGTVARARYSYGLNAYTATENYKNQAQYDADMREYFFERNPEWTILTVYVRGNSMGPVSQAFAVDPGPKALSGHYARNGYQFRIWSDKRFHDNYVHVRTWPRSASYYLSLWRRKDLWDQTPGEVILDSVPDGISGTEAKFSRDLDLLGSEIEQECLEKTEFYITTWWDLPGPMEKDINFFVHLVAPGAQVAYDHIPGDWMYPADRWKPGEIMENRILFQVPFGTEPGDYQVYIGVYRRTTGERLSVLDGPDDGTNRVFLGTVTIKPMHNLVHQTILTTDIEKTRKYPGRIVE